MAQDYSLVLMKVIEEAANDPAQLRKLVYVMAWYSLRPEAVISRPVLDAPTQAKTVSNSSKRWSLSVRSSA